VCANLAISTYGAAMLPVTAFLLIPFDMTARNVLHELWRRDWLIAKMGFLIFAGASLSYFLGGADASVCVASFVAFLAAGGTDSIIYQLLFDRPAMVKMNTSNAGAAIVDSIVFPLVAFGTIGIGIMLAQSSLKFLGGLAFSFISKSLVESIGKHE
jgi:hypothetical protein